MTLSSTVTVALQVETLPFTSVTVSVTVFAPISEQVNAFGDTTRDATAQLSELPLSTSVAEIVAFPEASNCTVMFWQSAVGATLSSTVTVELHEAVFPLPSVAVRTTVFAPTLAHVNASGVAAKVNEQLSEEPLSTSAATILAFPEASN